MYPTGKVKEWNCHYLQNEMIETPKSPSKSFSIKTDKNELAKPAGYKLIHINYNLHNGMHHKKGKARK